MAGADVSTRSGFHGVYPMAYAYFTAEGALARAPAVRLVEAMVAAGAHGVAALGLASEVNKLAPAERAAFLEWVVEAVDGRVPVSATIAENSIGEQVAFARRALAVGARWVILQPPPVSSVSEPELLSFFSAVIERIDAPVGIQNAPLYLKVGLSNAGLKELGRRHANFVVVKAEGSAVEISRLIEETDGTIDVFNGRGGLELPDVMRAGAAGVIPGGESFDRFIAIYEAMRRGEEDAAEAAYREVLPLIVFLEESIDHLVAYGKQVAAWRIGGGTVPQRIPSTRPSAFGLAAARRFAESLGPLAVERKDNEEKRARGA